MKPFFVFFFQAISLFVITAILSIFNIAFADSVSIKSAKDSIAQCEKNGTNCIVLTQNEASAIIEKFNQQNNQIEHLLKMVGKTCSDRRIPAGL